MKQRKILILFTALLLLAALLAFFLRGNGTSKKPVPPAPSTELDTTKKEDLSPVDTSISKAPEVEQSKRKKNNKIETIVKPVSEDTVPPYCYPDPSGGLFHDSVRISFLANEPCSIFFKTREMPGYSTWQEPLILRANEELTFYAMDSAGNASVPRSEIYDVEPGGPDRCPPEMAYVPSPEGSFCIDRYEWPNRKGGQPQAMVSYYAAADSCALAGKRLCSAQEWHLACTGKRTTRFAYGDSYEPRACNTNGAAPAASGLFVECRSYYGPMDMSGNLREWTSTKSRENPRFYDVRGGYWASHSQTGCEDSQYSFYPQNQHLSVGFRCCK